MSAEKREGFTRREVLTATVGGAAIAATVAGGVTLAGDGSRAASTGGATNSASGPSDSSTPQATKAGARLPVVYLPHGGGPWPFMEAAFWEQREADALSSYLRTLASLGAARPKAILSVSAHWEEKVPTVMTAERPPMFYDYSGFPPETYRIEWPAPGAPALAKRVRQLLDAAGIESAEDGARGFDHGTFVPLLVAFPKAELPTTQLSLERGLDPAFHLGLGRALAPLRDEGVLIVGSGMSYHNMRGFGGAGRAVAETFDAWLQAAASAEPALRDERLRAWASAPSARAAHPREEHLLPLMVVAGAAGADRGRTAYSDTFAGVRISAIHYG